jgi:rRNA maturation endonuclease Nob1
MQSDGKHPNNQNPNDQSIAALCHRCGKTFEAFLHQMEEQNAKVVCPDCGAENNCAPPPKKAARSERKH